MNDFENPQIVLSEKHKENKESLMSDNSELFEKLLNDPNSKYDPQVVTFLKKAPERLIEKN